MILNIDGLPLCPDCNHSLSCENAGNRDIETMGGYDIKYFYCEECKTHYTLIDNSLSLIYNGE